MVKSRQIICWFGFWLCRIFDMMMCERHMRYYLYPCPRFNTLMHLAGEYPLKSFGILMNVKVKYVNEVRYIIFQHSVVFMHFPLTLMLYISMKFCFENFPCGWKYYVLRKKTIFVYTYKAFVKCILYSNIFTSPLFIFSKLDVTYDDHDDALYKKWSCQNSEQEKCVILFNSILQGFRSRQCTWFCYENWKAKFVYFMHVHLLCNHILDGKGWCKYDRE